MLNTVTIPPKAIAGKKRKRGGKKRFNLLGLPNETLLNIFTHLDAYESAVLALACKRLALIATTYSQLECRSNSFRWWRPYREGHFLKKKVGDKYFGEDMGYCYNCKHYCPREKDYWKLVVEHQGEQKRWVQYIDVLVERWLADGDTQWPLENWENGVGKRWCPRCLIYKDKVLNVEYAYGTGRD